MMSSLTDVARMGPNELTFRAKYIEQLTKDPSKYKYSLYPHAGIIPYSPLSAMETLGFKVTLSAVMGAGLGFLLGVFMGPYSHSLAYDPLTEKLTNSQQMRVSWRQVKAHSLRSARNFGGFGAVYSGLEWYVEKKRAKRDIYNPLIAGAATGAAFAVKGGPMATCFGAVGMALFSYAIEWWQNSQH